MKNNDKKYLVRVWWYDKNGISHILDKQFCYSLDVEEYIILQNNEKNIFAFYVYDNCMKSNMSVHFLERLKSEILPNGGCFMEESAIVIR